MRERPRITVNKLGEYMVASPTRRERIIADQRDPKGFKTLRYNEAQEIITRYIVGGAKDDDYLNREIERLYEEGSTDSWQAQNSQLCAEALESFLYVVDALNTDGLTLQWGDLQPPKLQIGEVEVSVRPEVVVTRKNRLGDQCVGGMKLYFPKTYPLSKAAGEYVATTVYQFVTEHSSVPGKPDQGLCSVVDVSGGEVFFAPRAFKVVARISKQRAER